MDCSLCQKNLKEIDFKNIELLRRFISGLGKIKARKRTRLCSRHQKKIAKAVKQARHLGLLSTTEK